MEIALPIGVKHIKQYYNADFVLKDYDVNPGYINSRMYLYGYIKGHEDDSISIEYSYKTNEVIDVIGPSWFIQSRNPKIEAP